MRAFLDRPNMHPAMRQFLADPRDTGTPAGTVQLLKKLFAGELLSPKLTARLGQLVCPI